jgi:hypothetical protein
MVMECFMTEDEFMQRAKDSLERLNKMDVAMDTIRAKLSESKREWVGLTDDEINEAWDSNLSFARAIEAKLKEKNNG